MPKPAEIPARADYIVVGAGSAGAVIANRLSADPKNRVVLIEAGGESDQMLIQMPAGFARIVNNPAFDWCYETEPDPTTHGRAMNWPGGKMLGGGSSLNGQVFIRATQWDLDKWEAQGARGWAFRDVLPYFIRMENWHGKEAQNRGHSGPLDVAPVRDPHPLCQVFLDACNEMGIPIIEDYNATTADGAYMSQTNQRNGWRCSTEKAYLRPARDRSNLTILTHTNAEKIQLKDGHATGLKITRGGQEAVIACDRELILSAGAIASPVLMMRSGIGPAAELSAIGISSSVDLPGVGRNLQDHPNAVQQRKVNRRTLNMETGALDMIRHLAKFTFGRRGPLSAPAVQTMGLIRTDEALEHPDIQLVFMPLGYDILPETKSAASAPMAKESAVGISSVICNPHARGHIELDEHHSPRITYNMYDDERDMATMIAGQKYVNRLFETNAFRQIVTAPRAPDPIPATDEEWMDYIRWKTTTAFHASGTCRIGEDRDSVVDSELRVRGVSGLRIADASVMPFVSSVNTNATVIMIGEKAADLILSAA